MRNIALPPAYIEQVNNVVQAGGTITQKFETIAERWETFAELEATMQDELNKAILDPEATPAELAQLRALALAAQNSNPVTEAAVRNEAGAAILAALRAEYRTVAAANYETIRAKFNDKARELTAALETADAEASPEEMVQASAKIRAAWSEGPIRALELTDLMQALHTAATLAGKAEPTGLHDQCLIGLTTDTTGLHRRRVWEAWTNTTGRAGHWRELWKLGATIEAPELNNAKAYREPRPMEIRAERGGIGIYQLPHDPEDDAHRTEKDQLHKTAAKAGIHAIDYVDPDEVTHVH
ncbi:hypothetical protein [Paenarthrobacter sp. Y-19]|uniref:hypothetical protein n=1 Tax=Paenarthrobacter sp. Y-19 TaxID=3031125 RepID=UPI0023DB4FFF|nr:hypothetical protein [Paenarthrobacter sp. Y-19]